MTKKYELNSELVLSTGHISEKTNFDLQLSAHRNSKIKIVVNPFEYGYRVLTSDDSLDDLEGCPVDLRWLVVLSNSLGCKWLVLDQDGPLMDNLQTYDW
jgi:hypothetical protein